MYLPNVEEYGMIYTIVSIVWYVLLAAGLWKTFEKAHESGWKAIIPIYNFYLLFKIAWQSRMFWLWLAFSVGSVLLSVYSTSMLMYYIAIALSIVASVMLAVLWYNVSLAYGHSLDTFSVFTCSIRSSL